MAGALSGVPSTVHALVTRRPLLDAARAAGALVGRPSLPRGAVAHTATTLAWTAVLARVLPERHEVAWGAVAGAAISALDLAVAERHFPAIAALPVLPQLADHVAFGALVGWAFSTRFGD